MKYITDYKNLKIQFRAVSFAKSNHVLEYRVYPKQDLTYKKTVGFWIFKFSFKRKYSTKWHRPEHYWNHCTAKYYDEDEWHNWCPYFIENQQELDWYKNKFKTIGDFLKYHNEYSNKEYEKWKVDRENYLASKKTLY